MTVISPTHTFPSITSHYITFHHQPPPPRHGDCFRSADCTQAQLCLIVKLCVGKVEDNCNNCLTLSALSYDKGQADWEGLREGEVNGDRSETYWTICVSCCSLSVKCRT